MNPSTATKITQYNRHSRHSPWLIEVIFDGDGNPKDGYAHGERQRSFKPKYVDTGVHIEYYVAQERCRYVLVRAAMFLD